MQNGDRPTSTAPRDVYITVDIDVLDPAFAPATGTPEPGGLTTRELFRLLRGLKTLISDNEMTVVGADLVEVSPSYDTQAELTQLNGAYVVLDLIGLLGASVRAGRGRERKKSGAKGKKSQRAEL